ncbi:MAG TPA: glycogen debranching enzyme, partial [Streptosporangiaceae bacterium]
QDSLRYWVTQMHVDGFRFDLASILSRDESGRSIPNPPVLWDIESDPLLAGTKLIAEAWDAAGLYQVGSFVGDTWQEWNGRFRDDVRKFLKGDRATVRPLAARLLGSPDIYGHERREAEQSVNFVTAHDGFTAADLVSYNDKHNEANGEDNKDGESHNRSWNCGAEGETDNQQVLALRHRQQRNFLATLLLSQGVTMLLAGDETGRTQHGNNNAYCQDNEISWLDWEHQDEALLAFTRAMIALRREHPVLRRRRWFQGVPIRGSVDIGWCRPDGGEMSDEDWGSGIGSVGVFLNGEAITDRDRRGQRITDDSLLLLFNGHHEPIDWTLPKQWGEWWDLVVDTAASERAGTSGSSGQTLPVASRSVVVLIRRDAPPQAAG